MQRHQLKVGFKEVFFCALEGEIKFIGAELVFQRLLLLLFGLVGP